MCSPPSLGILDTAPPSGPWGRRGEGFAKRVGFREQYYSVARAQLQRSFAFVQNPPLTQRAGAYFTQQI